MRTEFPNLAAVSAILKKFCAPFLDELEVFPTPEEKLEAVRNVAEDEGEEEIVAICNYIEKKNLADSFFP